MSLYGRRVPKKKKRTGPITMMPRVIDKATAVKVDPKTYFMIREMCDYWEKSIAEVIRTCVDKEYRKILWEQEHAQIMQKVGKHVPRA
jgi:aspartate/tyrosine/aromatic aminotransferase